MSSLNRPVRLNRAVLATIGVVLLVAGVLAVAIQTGLFTPVNRDATLVPGTALPPPWVYYVVAAGAIVVALLAFRWLVAQLVHAPKTQTWQLEEDVAQGRTDLAASTAVTPFTSELTTCPGVHSAHATLAGDHRAPTLALVVSAEQDGDLDRIREHLDTHALPRLRRALDLETLPVTIEFRFSTKAGARVH